MGKTCPCLYCNSKCPECGSTNIAVKFQPTFEYENETQNRIFIIRGADSLEVYCHNCGETFFMDECHENESLEALRKALDDLLNLPHNIEAPIDGGGEVDSEPYHTEICSA